MSDSPWRTDPALAGRFHPDFPDDLQVVVHDGEPRRTQRALEACWVRVSGVDPELRMPTAPPDASPPVPVAMVTWQSRPVYRGRLLNAPQQLRTVRQDDDIRFVVAPGLPHPLMVTAEYVAERASWVICPCNRCGADQGLDPPTVMARTRFPGSDSAPVAFTAFCPCGGMLLVAMVDEADSAGVVPSPADPKRPWWKFW